MVLLAPTDQQPLNRRKTDHQPMPDLEEFMTTAQAAKELDYTVESVRQMVFKKKIESIRFGRSILIPRKAIKEYKEKTRGMHKHDPRRRTK
jgi:excisionase family DNA binding protein